MISAYFSISKLLGARNQPLEKIGFRRGRSDRIKARRKAVATAGTSGCAASWANWGRRGPNGEGIKKTDE